MPIWDRFLRAIGYTPTPKLTFRVDTDLIPVLRGLAEREQRPTEEIASDLLSYGLTHYQTADKNLRLWKSLTSREQFTVALACLGYSNREIAERLVVSPTTVKSHLHSAVKKFGVPGKGQLLQMLADWDFSAWDTRFLK